MQYIAILGRQPALGVAELESLYGASSVSWFSSHTAIVTTDSFSIQYLGGTQKAGVVIDQLVHGDWHQVSMKIVQLYTRKWAGYDGKITLGISAYGFDTPVRDIQKTGIVLKQKLKASGVSLRLIPNTDPALGSATSHHNKLGLADNKVELIVVRAPSGRIVICESTGAQNITALARRDQGRPKRDAFVGMLPPKLAQIIINLAATPVSSHPNTHFNKHLQPEHKATSGPDFMPGAKPFVEMVWTGGEQESGERVLLDPFCGTGVILQEAALMGYTVYGTDLSDKMIDYSRANLAWLADSHHIPVRARIHQGDAMDTTWQPPISAVACEGYLGQPFSAPPSPSKLVEVRGNCNHIMAKFLQNIAPQLTPGTPLCVAVPAWRDTNGQFTHLPLISQLEKLGYQQKSFKNVQPGDLLYYREDQIVARELLVLVKA